MKQLKGISFLLALAFVAMTGINAKVASELNLAVEADPELEIEAWMAEDDYWTSKTVIDLTPAVEETLKLEEWMVDDCYWK